MFALTECFSYAITFVQFLIDEKGKKYLDTRNNVAHVGHCNLKVAAAVAKQVFEINTNTRYYDILTQCIIDFDKVKSSVSTFHKCF